MIIIGVVYYMRFFIKYVFLINIGWPRGHINTFVKKCYIIVMDNFGAMR